MKANWSKIAPSLLVEILPKETPINQCAVMCELVRKDARSSAIRNELLRLSKSKDVFWNNYMVSDFANAALDLLGFVPYRGSRSEIKDLISAKLVFE